MYCLARSRRGSALGARYVRRVLSESISGKKKGGSNNKAAEGGKYSHTVQLPTTQFSQRANAAQREPEIQQYWAEQNIYEKVNASNQNGTYVLHDGPPYANGDLHIGHAMNKILKDFVVKHQLLQGRRVSFVPGWDCHGLPIELKVLQSLKSKEKKELTPLSLRARASDLACATMATQAQAFQRYGVWAEWSAPFATLHPTYEAQQIGVFGEMVRKGFIYRGKKPVHWSPSSHTALAEAELEYPPHHVSTSVHVGFRVVAASPPLASLLPSHVLQGLEGGVQGEERCASFSNTDVAPPPLKIAIWTTTPWSLPANQAVAVNPSLDYALITHPEVQGGAYFLVAKDLVAQFEATMTKSRLSNLNTTAPAVSGDDSTQSPPLVFTVWGEVTGADLVGTEYMHPVHAQQRQRVVVGGSYVTAESGTGLVHTAPGHGMDDFLTGEREKLDVVCPVDDYGRFTAEAGETLFKKDVLKEGNEAVIDILRDSGALLHVEAYPHKYPYDWRTKKPIIIRATEQWFASVEAFRAEVDEAIAGVTWVPAIGQKRISSMVAGRKDWCISRQRSWGVPLPVFYHVDTGEVLLTPETTAHVQAVVREQGSDAWWRLEVSELLPEALRSRAAEFTKGRDTMDVWFDSGTSWAGVLQERGGGALFPADMYLEGSDQHRGWFQSSLLTSVAATGLAPYKTVLTHGFVLDQKGMKMSKSLGNVVDPEVIINGGKNKKMHPAYGADTLRLWVAGVDYTSDVTIGDGILKQTSDTYRKLRNTLRFLLGSIADFDPATDSIPFEQLPSLDKFMLGRLTDTFASVDQSYSSFQFYKASNMINQFAINQLSNFYLDISKDRLYISSPDDRRRRSCQTVLHHVFEQFVLMMAPLVPHMAEDAFQNNLATLPSSSPPSSVFERGWLQDQARFESHESRRWDFVAGLRGDVNQCIELARRDKHIGASQECEVFLYVDKQTVPDADEKLQDILAMTSDKDAFLAGEGGDGGPISGVDDLRFLLLVSQVHLVSSLQALTNQCPEYHLPPTSSSVSSSVSSVSGSGNATGVVVGVRRAQGLKCSRCWFFSTSVQDCSQEVQDCSHDRRDLCGRCAQILS